MEKLSKNYQSRNNDSAKLFEISEDLRPEIRIITEEEKFDELRGEWGKLVNVAESTIFQTYEWNRIWWKHYGENGQLHLVVCYQDEKLVGIAPLFKDSITLLGMQRFLCLRFLGSDVSQPSDGDLLGLISYTDYLDFIIHPGFEDAVFSAFLHHFRTCNIDYDEILLDVVPQHSAVWNHFIPKLKEQGMHFSIQECLASQLITLEDSWENYLKTVSKNSRSHIRRALKKVHNPEQKIFNEFVVSNQQQVISFFEKMVKLHQTRWNRMGSLGTFAEKKNYEFHKEISRIFFKKGWLQINVLQPVDNPEKSIAIDINYRFKNRLYGVHSSLDMDSKYYSDGPGSVLLNITLKGVTDSDHLNVYDFMRGAEGYKLKLSNKTSLNRRIVLMNSKQPTKSMANLLKQYAVFRRYLYREWRQFLLFFESNSFWEACSTYTQFQFNRMRTKFRST